MTTAQVNTADFHEKKKKSQSLTTDRRQTNGRTRSPNKRSFLYFVKKAYEEAMGGKEGQTNSGVQQPNDSFVANIPLRR